MRRRIVSLTALLLLVFSLSAQTALAAEARTGGYPHLTFDGTIAKCSIFLKATSSTDKVKATLTLYQGNSYVDSWSDEGRGSVHVSGECEVQSGKDYTLVLTCSINGVEQKSVSTDGTCP